MKNLSHALRWLTGLAVITSCASDPEVDTGTGTVPASTMGTATPASSSASGAATGASAAGSGASATTTAKPSTSSTTTPATGAMATTPGAAATGVAGSASAQPDMTMTAAAGTGAANADPSATMGMGAAGADASAGAAGDMAPAAGPGAPGVPPLLPTVTTTDGPGPYSEVVKVKNTPPGGWMIYPKDIGKDGVKHPLFIFGPGGGTTPDTYEQMGMHWDRYGSYGFVIYVLPQSTGNGADMKAGLDWLISQNDDSQSPLYQNLDTSKVCAAGHSQGSVTVFDFMPDDRVTTTINISGGSFDGMGPSHLKNEAMFLCGPDAGADVAFNQCEGDFEVTTVPTFYTNIQGSTHITSGRMGWPAIIAWMLWHLAGQEEQWKKEFLEPTGQFQTGMYKSQIKNW